MLPRKVVTPCEAIEILKGQENRTRGKYRELLKQELEHIKRVRAKAKEALRKPHVAKPT